MAVKSVKAADYEVVQALALSNVRTSFDRLWETRSTEHCGPNECLVDKATMDLVQTALDLLKSQTVPLSVRLVNADQESGNEGEPVMLVIPPGMSDELAIDAVNSSIELAGRLSNDGRSGTYFEDFANSLASFQIAVEQGLVELPSNPWDRDSVGEQPEEGDPNWINVTFEAAFDDDQIEWQATLSADDSAVVINPEIPLHGFVSELQYSYPRSDKYGVPEAATEAGGRHFVAKTLGLACADNFETFAVDTGDDGIEAFRILCLVPRDCIKPVDRQTHQGR